MGPLAGIKVIEIAGIGASPFGAMMLADMGAEVLRIERPAGTTTPGIIDPAKDLLNRGRQSVALDLKKKESVACVLKLVASADALIEGFRPGVMERLGLGPEECAAANPKLVYGRLTGWGQQGPLAKTAGHDIDYIALSGALHGFGRRGEAPVPPINVVGDFGGGGLLLAYGVVCALLEAQKSGEGQVVDAGMLDGAALFTTMMHGMMAQGLWRDERGENLIDTGAHFYEVYETSDGKYLAIGAIEPQFYAALLSGLGLAGDTDLKDQMNAKKWPGLKEKIAACVIQKTREEWCAIFDGTDACVAPVLAMREAAGHPHNAARGTFVEEGGIVQPAPAPRFSRSQAEIGGPPPLPGQHSKAALADWGFDENEIASLVSARALFQRD